MITDQALAGLDAKQATALVLTACDLDQDLCKSPFGEVAQRLASLAVATQWAIATAAGRPLTRERLLNGLEFQSALDLAGGITPLPAEATDLRTDWQQLMDGFGADAAWRAAPDEDPRCDPRRLYGFTTMHYTSGFAIAALPRCAENHPAHPN